MRNWPGSGSPTVRTDGYQFTWSLLGASVHPSAKKPSWRPRATAPMRSSSRWSASVSVIQASAAGRSSAGSNGHRLDSTNSALPGRWAGKRLRLSLRSGGVSTPVAEPFASTPGGIHPGLPSATAR